MSITDFKGRVREEVGRPTLIGLAHGLSIDDSDTIKANLTRQTSNQSSMIRQLSRHELPPQVILSRTDYSSHSIRKRATVSATAWGISMDDIKLMRRWKSERSNDLHRRS